MNNTTNFGQNTVPPQRELSAGSKLRFWKQAYLAALQGTVPTMVARMRANEAVADYNAKFQELFPS